MMSTRQRSKFLQECLERTNEHRSRHGVPWLTLNSKLSSIAQAWADSLLRADRLEHNPKAKYMDSSLGENVAFNYKSSEEVKGSEMIDQWYNEIKDYNFNTHSSTKTTGHFTQLVWKNSNEVGFGLAASHGKHYLVANYYPAGNYVGQNRENVFPPRGGKVSTGGADGNGMKANKSSPVVTHKIQTILNPTHNSTQPQTLSFPQFNWSFKLPVENPEPRSHSKNAVGNLFKHSTDAGPKNVCREEPPWTGARTNPNSSTSTNIYKSTATSTNNSNIKDTALFSDRFSRISLSNRCTPAPRRIDLDPGNYVARNSSTLIFTETYNEPEAHEIARCYTNASGDESFGHVNRAVQRGHNIPSATPEVGKRSWNRSRTEQQFSDEIVSGHNKLRTRHKAPNLTINPIISSLAQSWAENLARGGELKLSGNKYLGETLGEGVAMKYSSLPVDYEASELLDKWYSENNNYNFKYPNENSGIDRFGHFTQMVWKDSREIGVGKAWSQGGKKVFVVCNYFPAGNVVGSFRENVLQ